MTVLMKTAQNKLLHFPKQPEESTTSPIVFQIGKERFAIHYQVENLPPVAPLLQWKRPGKKARVKRIR